MKYTKEELDKLNKDPMAHRLATMMGLDLNKIIEEEKQAIDNELNKNKKQYLSDEFNNVKNEFEELNNIVSNSLNKLVEDGILTCEEVSENGVTRRFYRPANEEPQTENEKPAAPIQEKKEYQKPTVKTQPFLMSAEQLEKFINDYSELVENEKRLNYVYGIEFKDGNSGWGFPSKINEVIWDLIRIIFGDENAEDIADYIFGNSNFDDVKSLYEELV